MKALSAADVMRRLGCKKTRACELIREAGGYKVGRLLRVDEDDFEAYLELQKEMTQCRRETGSSDVGTRIATENGKSLSRGGIATRKQEDRRPRGLRTARPRDGITLSESELPPIPLTQPHPPRKSARGRRSSFG